MASANLEFVKSIVAPWERGDFSSADWADPEIEFVLEGGPADGSFRGLAEMSQAYSGFLGAWERVRTEAEVYRELDGERVLVTVRFSGRGKTSGLEVGETRTRGAALFHVRGGKVARLVLYWDRDRALADLGLDQASEQNLATVRALSEQWDRGEPELAFDAYDEAITWDARAAAVPELAGGVFHGHDGVRAFWRQWLDAWDFGESEMGDEALHRAHGNQVISSWHQRLIGRDSRLEFEFDPGIVWTFLNGRIVHVALFSSADDALRATGLER